MSIALRIATKAIPFPGIRLQGKTCAPTARNLPRQKLSRFARLQH